MYQIHFSVHKPNYNLPASVLIKSFNNKNVSEVDDLFLIKILYLNASKQLSCYEGVLEAKCVAYIENFKLLISLIN